MPARGVAFVSRCLPHRCCAKEVKASIGIVCEQHRPLLLEIPRRNVCEQRGLGLLSPLSRAPRQRGSSRRPCAPSYSLHAASVCQCEVHWVLGRHQERPPCSSLVGARHVLRPRRQVCVRIPAVAGVRRRELISLHGCADLQWFHGCGRATAPKEARLAGGLALSCEKAGWCTDGHRQIGVPAPLRGG